MKRKSKLKIIILIIAFLGIGVTARMYYNSKNQKIAYSSEKATKSNLALSYDVSGVVEAKKVVTVFSNNEATVEKINFREGEQVKKNDTLLILKGNQYDTKKLNIEQAEAILALKAKEYEDAKALYEVGGISKDGLELALLEYKEALTKTKLNKNEYVKFDKYIKSPISGVILESNVDANFTIDKRKPLFKIADTENLQISLEVANSSAKNIKVDQNVTVVSESLENGKVLNGKVKSVSNISFKSSKSNENITKVLVELEDYANLKPGDYVEANIIYKNIEDQIIVPFQYIINKDGKNYVYINKNNTVEMKEIVLGDNDGINFEIKSGINENDELIYNVNNTYKVGDKIK
ncbi:efflux RND transporter periplasmic adaptor subunit [Oceanivirga salmonicida]|uniref:efflux RND transporter periplasmic adaptor subunit n=1 Tax=Oceanivirga salmonicida TaxID=1769291 RepID=UPI0008299357|nr:efflux RND transporter periplasmic adaptor subunit [Oceanivirga salmonicida]